MKTKSAVVSGVTLREIKAVVKACANMRLGSEPRTIRTCEPNETRRRAKMLYQKIELLGAALDLDFGLIDGEKTQEQSVLDYMYEGNKITSLEAMKLFGILKLNSVICNLRRKGHDIKIATRVVGDKKNISEYFIEKDNENEQ